MKNILLLCFFTGSLARADAQTTNTPPLGWSNIVAVLAAQAATGPERDIAQDTLAGWPVRLTLEFVTTEPDLDGNLHHVYRHTEGKFSFECFVRGKGLGPGSGLITGRLDRVRYAHVDKRGARMYFLWVGDGSTESVRPPGNP